IQLDMILVCRKNGEAVAAATFSTALASAKSKLARLTAAGLRLSRNDCRIVLIGQMLTTLRSVTDAPSLLRRVALEVDALDDAALPTPPSRRDQEQLSLF